MTKIHILLGMLAAGGAGCTIPIKGTEGTVHHVIIGVGIVSTPKRPQEGMGVSRSNALGIAVTDQPGLRLGIGYSANTIVTVTDGASNVVAEVSARPGGPLKVQTPATEK